MDNWAIENILVADDEDAYRGLVQMFLQSLHYTCEAAADAFEALNRLRQKPFELLITDLRMPGKDGMELAREALKEYPQLAVIIMTGHASAYSFSDIVGAGVSDFITKPFEVGELKAKIERIARERHVLHDLRNANEELQQTTLFLENVLENSPDGVAIVDKQGRFTKWNKAAAEAYGYTFQELGSKSPNDLYVSEAQRRTMMAELRRVGYVRKYEVEMRKKDGTTAPFELSIGLLKDKDGRIIGSVGLGRDVSDLRKTVSRLEIACTQLQQEITERQRVEEILGESERRFREILENIHLLAISLDTEGRINFCNDFFLSVAGWQREELLGRDWFDTCLPPDSRARLRGSYAEEIALGKITAHGEDEIITGRGKRCLVAWNNTLLRDPQGKVIGVTKIGRDVSQSRKMEKELREASAEMELLIANIPSILIELSENDRVTRWNSASESTFGLSSAEVLGVPLAGCALRWDWGKIHGSLLACRRQRTSVRADDVRFVRSDGKEGLLGLTISPIKSELGDLQGFIILGADISERRLLERQLAQAQKLESIGQLAAGIAHEINTPTQYVGDNTRFLRDAFKDLESLFETYAGVPEAMKADVPTDKIIRSMHTAAEEADLEYLKEEIPRAIQQSLEGVERVSKIVAAMKEFSHPGVTEKTALDINRAIESTVTVARNEWKYVAELTMDLDQSMPPVPCLPGEFNQVILNIIINAAHALGTRMAGKDAAEKGIITVSTRNLGDQAEIRIRDTGTGIPENIRSRVFDPFFTTKDVGKGTGQGLAIAHSVIVDKHGGTICFESEMGKGTVFIITLPLISTRSQEGGEA